MIPTPLFTYIMVYSVAQYILSVKNLDKMSRTLALRSVRPVCDDNGELKCRIGNSVIVFEVMCGDVPSALRVYMRPHTNLRAIYGDKYLPDELLVNTSIAEYSFVDVVLNEWYDGVTLQRKIEQVCGNPAKMLALSHEFEELALSLLSKPWAHGDLKPENIIVGGEGMQLIDFDAMFLPGFTSDDCVEIGTNQYQHPLRDKSHFNKSVDDYPIALIATALAALSIDGGLGGALSESDALLIKPQRAVAGEDAMLEHIERLFAEVGDVRHYRIAKLLRSPLPSLPQLKSLLEMRAGDVEREDEELLLEYGDSGWGYTLGGEFIIPPYYDMAFEFREGLGLVAIDDVWHFIDTRGRVVITCGRGGGIKPFRNGVTQICREDGSVDRIYRDNRIEKEI